ncbi:hypothetical protein M8J77_024255 [Diaphorina citri]|nr:hypothetical protein M8J77_024255 [Diaphorina citri]
MLKISCMDKVNITVLRRMQKNQLELMNTIKERKLKFAGHILRRPEGTLLKDVMEGTIGGARPRGRPRILWMDDIKEWLSITSREALNQLAANRDLFRTAVSTSIWQPSTAMSPQ